MKRRLSPIHASWSVTSQRMGAATRRLAPGLPLVCGVNRIAAAVATWTKRCARRDGPAALIALFLLAASPGAPLPWAAAHAAQGLSAGDYVLAVPGWSDRAYTLHLPTNYTDASPVAVVIAIHAAGGDAQSMAAVTCPNGNPADPGCLRALADRETFAIVYPSATPGASTWNAGGGANGFECIQGQACANNIDDVGYLRDLIQEVKRVISVDAGRVYATGYSNGASMSHRLACELGDQLAAIAPVAGVNQFSALATCAPARSVAVVEFHGTGDQISPYDGGQGVHDTGIRVSVLQTISGWVARNSCSAAPAVVDLPDVAADGTTVRRSSYTGCSGGADVTLYTVNGGGHTWPGGTGLPDPAVGATTFDISATQLIWDFFRAHPRDAAGSAPVAAVLPSSRSVMVGTPATAFVTVINTASGTATGVTIGLATAVPVSFSFQSTDPATNARTGTPNTPVDIAAGQPGTFLITLTPTAPFDPTDVSFRFAGSNTAAATPLPGINTLLLSASAGAVPDIVALTATLGGDGIVNIPGSSATGVFAVASVNVGVSGAMTVVPEAGSGHPAIRLALCETNPATGQCTTAIQPSVSTVIDAGETPTFGVFVTGDGVVPFDPAVNRVFVRFKDAAGLTRGATSVAVRTQQPSSALER